MESTTGSTSRAAWTVEEFAEGARIHRATFYKIPAELRPASIKIGKRTVIIESPAAWLARVHKRGGVPTITAAA